MDGSKNENVILWLVFPLEIAVVKSCNNSILTNLKKNSFFCKCRGLLNLSKQNDLKRQNVILKYELQSDYSDPYDQNLN